ncbi:alkaline phosphatase [Bacteroides sp. GD17]|jgi:alkaline phosphatase|uniref:alkaline phosphatase n=1 Tax=Bacteroides sp. GD17 TaxID=3139826 RepID=UPI0025EEC6A7|nr:alkaline phosphatase [uncultured Bacteroides sp.]
MRKLSSLLFLLVLSVCIYAQQAKYVFYFIGDGMGVNQVQGTEIYRAELEEKMGISPLLFTQFPYSTVALTNSGTNRVTDSAAAGTALATGYKTKNSAIGILKDQQTPVNSVAVWAKNKGCRVGIATSVTVNHATPGAFYAHAAKRTLYHEIGKDLYKTGFDFYAGSDFRDVTDPDNPPAENLYTMADKNGYTIARGYKDYLKKSKKADKMIMLQTEEASNHEYASIPYAIDRKKGGLTLQDITRSAINFLSKDPSKGFFLMVEGGKIDWACHSNDAATVFHEIIDFDSAIKTAYEFYSQHPDETLIVVTADHETGGFVLGTGTYDLNLQVLKNQKVSENGFTRIVNEMRTKTNNQVSWEAIQQALKDNFGFWEKVELTEQQEARLKTVYDKSLKNQEMKQVSSEYAQDEPIASEAKRIINEIALVGWTSGGHSAGYVPVFAIGAGADLFQGRIDNTQIPIKIAQAAGYIQE